MRPRIYVRYVRERTKHVNSALTFTVAYAINQCMQSLPSNCIGMLMKMYHIYENVMCCLHFAY